MSDRPSEARRLSGIRVLIVEDDSDCLEALVTLLELNGAEAQGAWCADAGRKVLARFRPHVLISDLSMPGEDGFTFLGSVRALSRRDGGGASAVRSPDTSTRGANIRDRVIASTPTRRYLRCRRIVAIRSVGRHGFVQNSSTLAFIARWRASLVT